MRWFVVRAYHCSAVLPTMGGRGQKKARWTRPEQRRPPAAASSPTAHRPQPRWRASLSFSRPPYLGGGRGVGSPRLAGAFRAGAAALACRRSIPFHSTPALPPHRRLTATAQLLVWVWTLDSGRRTIDSLTARKGYSSTEPAVGDRTTLLRRYSSSLDRDTYVCRSRRVGWGTANTRSPVFEYVRSGPGISADASGRE